MIRIIDENPNDLVRELQWWVMNRSQNDWTDEKLNKAIAAYEEIMID